jgi:hypothetical protein
MAASLAASANQADRTQQISLASSSGANVAAAAAPQPFLTRNSSTAERADQSSAADADAAALASPPPTGAPAVRTPRRFSRTVVRKQTPTDNLRSSLPSSSLHPYSPRRVGVSVGVSGGADSAIDPLSQPISYRGRVSTIAAPSRSSLPSPLFPNSFSLDGGSVRFGAGGGGGGGGRFDENDEDDDTDNNRARNASLLARNQRQAALAYFYESGSSAIDMQLQAQLAEDASRRAQQLEADSAAAALALARAGLADGLDLQALHAFSRTPTADTGDAGVDDAGDARDG